MPTMKSVVILAVSILAMASRVLSEASDENSSAIDINAFDLQQYRASPKLLGPAKFKHAQDPVLDDLDHALEKISTVYIQALFTDTHTPSLELRMHGLEIELFDLLNKLYKQNRINEYMRYEAEVTRQMIVYNMLKKLFGYSAEANEEIK